MWRRRIGPVQEPEEVEVDVYTVEIEEDETWVEVR
jgi:hypothetical protein